ncbi:MAG: hypothetical protein HY072_04000, partial [Deltaproteobacteria bacterium]|nr:hypothetical protein [Deltaproteobacteria bacterium]
MKLKYIILCFFITFNTFSADLPPTLKDKLILRNKIDQIIHAQRAFLFEPKTLSRLNLWLNQPVNRSFVTICNETLKALFPSEKLLGPICYFLRQDDLEKRKTALDFINLQLLQYVAILSDISEDPYYLKTTGFTKRKKSIILEKYSSLADKASKYLIKFKSNDFQDLATCFEPFLNEKWNDNNIVQRFSGIFRSGKPPVRDCINEKFGNRKITEIKDKESVDDDSTVEAEIISIPKYHFTINFPAHFEGHPGHIVSPSGWSAGNKVEYLNKNNTSLELQEELDKRNPANLMKIHYPLDGAGSMNAFYGKIKSGQDVFNESGFYPSVYENPVWSQSKKTLSPDEPNIEHETFREIIRIIDNAKESIFMDVFFLGGTMGASLAKHIVGRLEKERLSNSSQKLKVFILKDTSNHYGHLEEMRPVFNYLLAYSLFNPKALVVAGSYIIEHGSALPSFIADFVSEDFFEKSGLTNILNIPSLNSYVTNATDVNDSLPLDKRGVSDHSKTIVVDGLSENPIATVGSKNLTDASGAICYDEVIKVSGPAAAAVLDDYYQDMKMALTKEMIESERTLKPKKGY